MKNCQYIRNRVVKNILQLRILGDFWDGGGGFKLIYLSFRESSSNIFISLKEVVGGNEICFFSTLGSRKVKMAK